jgi:hypothetical protein
MGWWGSQQDGRRHAISQNSIWNRTPARLLETQLPGMNLAWEDVRKSDNDPVGIPPGSFNYGIMRGLPGRQL